MDKSHSLRYQQLPMTYRLTILHRNEIEFEAFHYKPLNITTHYYLYNTYFTSVKFHL